ncbi:hypothetical protein ACFLVW_03660 [Chloroflexota bacterium]
MRGIFWLFFIILCVILVGCSTQSEPDAEQIKADLIGHNLAIAGSPVWEFAALSEYEQFNIKGTQMQGNVIEYDISMKLLDQASNTHFVADALIVYRKNDGKWELISVVAKLFDPASSLKTY